MFGFKSGAAAQRDRSGMRLFFRLASFLTGFVVPAIAAGQRLAGRKKALASRLTRILEHTLA